MPDFKSKAHKAAQKAAAPAEPGGKTGSRKGQDDYDERMFDEVDVFHGLHKKGSGLRMVGDDDDDDSNDEDGAAAAMGLDMEPVMDLGVGDSDDDEDDDDDEKDSDNTDDSGDEDAAAARAAAEAREEAILSGWGTKRSAYHGGDGDVEIDEEAAAAEEEEAVRLQRKRAAALEEDDFTFGYTALGSGGAVHSGKNSKALKGSTDASNSSSSNSSSALKKKAAPAPAPAPSASKKGGKALLPEPASDASDSDDDDDDLDGPMHTIAAAIVGKAAQPSASSSSAGASRRKAGGLPSSASAADGALVSKLDASVAALDRAAAAAAAAGGGGGSGGKGKKGRAAGGAAAEEGVEVVSRQLGSLTRAEKLDMVLGDTPELIGLLGELQDKAGEVRGVLAPILDAVRDGRLGSADASTRGLSFLEVKAQLVLAYVADIVFYLLLKAEGRPVRDHPVIGQLVEIRATLERMRPLEARLAPTIAKLLAAAHAAPASSSSARGKGAGDHDDSEEGGGGGDDGSEGGGGVDYSDVRGHPAVAAQAAARAAAKAARDAARASGSSSASFSTARPNPGALLTHGDERRALGQAAEKERTGGKVEAGKMKGKGAAAMAARATAAGGHDEEAKDGGVLLAERQPQEQLGAGPVEGGAVGADGAGGTYRPLRRSAVPYDGDPASSKAAKEEQRRAARLARSALLADMKAAYSDAPEEAQADGGGGAKALNGSGMSARLDRIASERRAHEEDMYSRVGVTKAEKKERSARAREARRWDSLAELESFGDVAGLLDGNGGEDGEGLPSSTRRGGGEGAVASAAARTTGAVAKALKSKRAAVPGAGAEKSDEGEDGDGAAGQGAARGIKRRRGADFHDHDDDDEGDDDEGGGGGGQYGGRGGRGEEEEEGDDPFYSAVAAAAAAKRAKVAAFAASRAAATSAFIRSRPDEDALRPGAFDAATGDAHRKASRAILANRGLVKYRKREDKNPRVAYRNKAAKAEKRRAGQVVKMRGPGDRAAYGGEATGIRAGVTKSRKIRS